ncbi:DgyrCDS715 [Dimorphilus gyrociliatus]|nr:DgyrCDS715 [Dimorphilus gyrociliatus]
MYEKMISQKEFICKQGEPGNALYVLAQGCLEVTQDGKTLGHIKPGKVIGELAILYNCSRTASIQALEDGKLWVLDRKVFKTIMMKSGLERQDRYMKYLEKVELLEKLGKEQLAKIADVIEEDCYFEGDHIVREGERGDTFFIINEGHVRVEKRTDEGTAIELNRLGAGKYFGEKALLSEEYRTASVIAASKVVCLTVERDAFCQLVGDLNELRDELANKRYTGEDDKKISGTSGGSVIQVLDKYKNIELDHLNIVATLGVGGFGRVELVTSSFFPGQSLALKCLKKKHIVETRQQEHVKSEKKIMMEADSPFIAKLFKTFRDRKFVYLLMEACLGGELWTVLRINGTFDDPTARFCVACVLEAFEYLHNKNIIYRDLKPENLLVDSSGFVKLVDFGFAKKLMAGRKTWTFCGTPEYVAPEIILNKGHDFAADYWAIGILMFELLTGNPPFVAPDPMKTYNIILEGVEKLDMPKKVGRNATNLIKKLCKSNPTERLGYGKNGLMEIRKHRWFQGFDWDGLRSRSIPVPKSIKPTLNGPTDTSVFDHYEKDTTIPEDEISGWDENF